MTDEFLKECGRYRRVEDIPADEKAEMLKRINADEIDGHRRRSKIHNRIYQAKKAAREKMAIR